MSFDERAKADLDLKMARAERAKGDAEDDSPDKAEGIVDETKDKLHGLVDKAKDVLHHDHADRGGV